VTMGNKTLEVTVLPQAEGAPSIFNVRFSR